MAGATIDSQLSAGMSTRVRFIMADKRHDGEIRRLLRDNPMPGEVTLTFEREPNFFIGSRLPGVMEDQTIIALEDDRVVCMGGCSVRWRYLNGKLQRVGYLSGLRLDHSAQGRFDIMRRGYQFFAESNQDASTTCFFTSIASDNARSLRILERGLPGMPHYRFLSEYVTLLLPISDQPTNAGRVPQKALRNLAGRGLRYTRGSKERAGQLARFLNNCGKDSHFATHWTEDELLQFEDFGLPITDFHVVRDGETIVAAAAVWDQRSFKQTVIRSYSQRLSLLRPWINIAGRLLGTPGLPKTNFPLEHAFLSPCAAHPAHDKLLPDLIRLCLPAAASRGIKFLTVGFAKQDPRIKAVQAAFRCREYLSRLYQVAWNHDPLTSEPLDSRPFCPELALL